MLLEFSNSIFTIIKQGVIVMKVAVITGASSGMGREFALTLNGFGKFDEVWLIARREDRLGEVAKELGVKTKVLAWDLSKSDTIEKYKELLQKEKPDIKLLINASGFGKFCRTDEVSEDVNLNMIDLNCKAIVYMCQLSLEYMSSGSNIINIASVAAMQPVPYINVYAATKAFVLSYSRALNREFKSKGITTTAVCPFWTKTEFFDRAVKNDQKAVVKKYVAMYDAKKIVKRAYRDAKKKKDVSKFGFIARFQMFLAKILPHSFVMSYWQRQQKLKNYK